MNNKKIFIIIFLIAFLIRLAALFSFAEEKSLLYVNDSQTYLQTAKNILEHGVYSMEISDTPHPDNFRTPLYPLFLLPFIWLKTSLYLPAVVQSIIMSFGIGLIFWLGQKIFSRKVAIIATILFALEPQAALISAQIMTEAIFTPLFTIAIILLVLYIKTLNWRQLALGAALLALAALARPIAFYLFLIFPIAVFLTKQKTKISWQHIGMATGIFFILVSPWLWFMIVKLHTFNFSSIIGMQVYEYHGRYFDKWRAKHGAPANDRLSYIDLGPINDTFNAQAIPPVKAVGVAYLKNHFPQYFWFHFIRVPHLFMDSGYTSILNGISRLNFKYDTAHGAISSGFLEQIDWQHLDQTLIQIKNQPLFLVLLFADLFFVIITLLALSNPFFYYKFRCQWPKEIIFLIAVILLYSVIASPICGPRFRIPINPFLFLLAINTAFTLSQLRQVKITNVKNL